MRRLLPAILLMLLPTTGEALAHGGGLNAQGCHTNRKTGDYHCHGKTSSSSATPAPRPQRATTNTLPPAPQVRAFRNCSEARAAGAAPVRRSDPGYGPHLDRDNDGIGCE
ncbi:excalibur calcium-binding domain-containing protein [Hyphomonas atlantica corrig.]|uniref:excalibur calcium-binding domain-containing protein n=1 Tax=Hyphomonas atlantica TaxID=1280948 RepID=UPI003081183C